jgi:hypothetical protein
MRFWKGGGRMRERLRVCFGQVGWRPELLAPGSADDPVITGTTAVFAGVVDAREEVR